MCPLFASIMFVIYSLHHTFAELLPASSSLYDTIQKPFQDRICEQGPWPTRPSLEQWLEEEEKVALTKILANIAPGGYEAQGAVPGTVIASPSRELPNYYYQWTRDSAITMSTLLDILDSTPDSSLSSKILHLVHHYANLQSTFQHKSNPSGAFNDLSGLGEPKFRVDGEAFTAAWGRPQHDGPALRAIALIHFVHQVNDTDPSLWYTDEGRRWFETLYSPTLPANSTIKADLEYTSRYWKTPGFDLWEEAQGLHFYTGMVQYRALRDGAQLAAAFGDWGAEKWYEEQANQMSYELFSRFWDHDKGHLVATLNTERSGLDCGILLATLHSPNQSLRNSSSAQKLPFTPWSSQVLSTLKRFVEDQEMRYPINTKTDNSLILGSNDNSSNGLRHGIAIGRYPEDEYNGYEAVPEGGNPWFICTHAVAETMYRTAEYLLRAGELSIADLETPFWQFLLDETGAGNFPRHMRTLSTWEDPYLFEVMLTTLIEIGDSYLEVVKSHAGAEGSMSEQIHHTTGFQTGARDLTWSYGSFLSALRARKAVMLILDKL